MIPSFFPVTFINQRLDWILYSWELALTLKETGIIWKAFSLQKDSFLKRSTTAILTDSNTTQLLQVILKLRKGLKSQTQEMRKCYLTQIMIDSCTFFFQWLSGVQLNLRHSRALTIARDSEVRWGFHYPQDCSVWAKGQIPTSGSIPLNSLQS